MKRCLVVYALPDRQWQWQVTLADPDTIAEALEQARAQAGSLEVPWEGEVGIFGALCDRNAVPRDGDRIEIYRPLRADPKVSRRERVKAGKAERDRALSRRPSPQPARNPKSGPDRQ
jgi:putative ubiquitin-RnfH superfamily antitoxin RatB of RatAB toxin-antitoxin module